MLFSIGFSSCNKNGDELANQLKDEDYNVIGVEHNKALDHVFNQLKTKKLSFNNLKSADNVLVVAEEVANQFIMENSELVEIGGVQIALEQSEYLFDYGEKYHDGQITSAYTVNCWPQEVDDLLSEKQKAMLLKLNNIADTPNPELDKVIRDITALEEQIKIECDESDIEVLLIATSVAKNSFQYWHDYGDDWIELCTERSDLKGWRDFRWEQVGKVDIAAGIGGAIAGGAIGAVAAGAGAGPGAVAGGVGGAIGGSITDAILQIWSSQTIREDRVEFDPDLDLGDYEEIDIPVEFL